MWKLLVVLALVVVLAPSSYALAIDVTITATPAYVGVPIVTCSSAINITSTSGVLVGNIVHIGGANATTRGFDWGYSTGNYTWSWNETGNFGTGVFYHEITGLTLEAQVFWRAFAINTNGQGNSTECSFLVGSGLPLPPTDFEITQTSADSANLTWTMGVTADRTIIRGSDNGYPSSITDGYLVYNGTGTLASVEGLLLSTNAYYYRAWSWNIYGYSLDYAQTRIGGDMQAILMFGLLFLVAIGFIVVYLWKREMWLGIAAGTVWVATAIYAWVGYEAPTEAMTTMWFGLGWLFLAIGLALLVAPMSWNKTRDEIWEESFDPDTGEPFMEEYKGGNKTGRTRPLTDLEIREKPEEKRKRNKPSQFSQEGRL